MLMKKNLVYEDSYQILLKFQLLRRLLWKQFSHIWCNVCNTYLNKQIFVCVNWFRHMLAHVSAIACLSRQRLRYMLAYTHAWMTIWGARNMRCKKCEVLDPVCEHVIRARKNLYQDFQFLKSWILIFKWWTT